MILWSALLGACAAGCQVDPAGGGQERETWFAPSAMRIHPVFTRVRDWTGDGKPDGIEALVEFNDRFGDPTKATGRLLFELHEYQPYQPDARGVRLSEPWEGDLFGYQDQIERWDRTSRSYRFPLAFSKAKEEATYVLSCTYTPSSGGRLFDRILIRPAAISTGSQEPLRATTRPESTR